MDTNERTNQLRKLMDDHRLSDANVAEMLGRTPMTVKIWRCQTEESKCIPAHMLELLALKLAQP